LTPLVEYGDIVNSRLTLINPIFNEEQKMGLKLTIGRGDLILLSGGLVVTVDDIVRRTAVITIVNSKGEREEVTMDSERGEAKTIYPGISMTLESVYFSTKHGEAKAQIQFFAPKKVRIHRLHHDAEDEMIVRTLANFTEKDGLARLVENVKIVNDKLLT